LENLSRDALEQHQELVRKFVRHRQGIYALYRRGKLYYVGLASNLSTRLSSHLKNRHGDSWDRLSVYLTIGEHHMRELESLIVRIVKPPGNKQKGRFAKSEDLRRSFKRDWHAEMRLKLDNLLGRPASPVARQIAVPMPAGRRPVLFQYITGKMTLRARYKGKTLLAYVRKTGLIWFDRRHLSFKKIEIALTVLAMRWSTPDLFWTSNFRAPIH